MIRFLILIGYVEWMLSLRLSGKLDQYINAHYQYLITLSIILASILAVVQLIVWVQAGKKPSKMNIKEDRYLPRCTHPFEQYKWYQRLFIYILLCLPLFAAYFLPTVTLDASIVQAKGFSFPESKETSKEAGDIDIQYLKPNTHIFFNDDDYEKRMNEAMSQYDHEQTLKLNDQNFLTVAELIYNYPSDFVDKEISFKGFVFHDPVDQDSNHFFVFRFGILHCVADAGVFGFLCVPTDEQTETTDLKNNFWVEIKGKIEQQYYEPFKSNLPVIQIQEMKKIKQPSNPYVYYDF